MRDNEENVGLQNKRGERFNSTDGVDSTEDELAYRKIFKKIVEKYITHTDKSEEYQKRFQDYIRDLYDFTFQATLGLLTVIVILAWPTDLIIYEDFSLLFNFFLVRLFLVLGILWYLVTVNYSEYFGDRAPELFILFTTLMISVIGIYLGKTGEFRITFWIAYIVPFLTIMLPLKFFVRAGSTFLISFSFYISFYLNFAGSLDTSFYYSRALVISGIALGSILIGHIFYHLNRRYYFGVVIKDEEIQEIERHFKYRVSDQILESIIENYDDLLQEGSRKEITVLRIKINNFYSFESKVGRVNLPEFVNKFLTFISDHVRDHNGVLDQYWGNLITAEFGLLDIEKGDHAERACFTSLKILSEWKGYLDSIEAPTNDLSLNIGLHSGLATVGNFGTNNLMNLSAMGSVMDQANKLSVINSIYGSKCVLTEPSYLKVKNNFDFRCLDRVSFQENSEYITIYELLGRSGESSEKTLELKQQYDKGLQLYWNTEFSEASEIFEKLLEEHPDDGPSKKLQERCNEFKNSAPPPHWNGALKLSEE